MRGYRRMPRGTCVCCNGSVALLKNGNVWPHLGDTKYNEDGHWCGGSWEPPLQPPDADGYSPCMFWTARKRWKDDAPAPLDYRVTFMTRQSGAWVKDFKRWEVS